MKNALLALIAIGAGALASDWLARLPVVHEVAGQIFQRGKLIALVGQRGVFEADLGARLREKQFCAGREDSDEAERVALREELIAGEALPTNAVTTNESERALVALRNQFADDRQFRVALQHSGVSQRTLRRALAETIRGEAWGPGDSLSRFRASRLCTRIAPHWRQNCASTGFACPHDGQSSSVDSVKAPFSSPR